MDFADDIRSCQCQQVVVTGQVRFMILELFTTIVCFSQLFGLNHGSHCPIQNQDALAEGLLQKFKGRVLFHQSVRWVIALEKPQF